MIKDNTNLLERLESCRDVCTELSRTAGITKGLRDLSFGASDPKARTYFKFLWKSLFMQLMIGLNVLTLDSRSDIKMEELLKDFETQYGGRLKELGLSGDIEKEREYTQKLSASIKEWHDIRNQHAAHFDLNGKQDWRAEIDDISLFIISVQHIINTMIRTIAVPAAYPKTSTSVTYNSTSAVNLEEESFKDIKDNLSWKN